MQTSDTCKEDRQPPVGAPNTGDGVLHTEDVPATPYPDTAPLYDTVRASQLRAVGTAFLRRRPLIVGPAMVFGIVGLALSGAPSRQVIAFSAGLAVMLAGFTLEALRCRRIDVSERWLFNSLAITVTGISVGCLATGALRSPVLPLLFAPSVTAFAAFGRDRRSDAILAWLLLHAAALALVPAGFPFPPVTAPFDILFTAVTLITSLVLLRTGVAGLTDAYRRSGAVLDRMRADLYAETASRARSLEAVGAKVAHELKNPLSSIKGLVQLQARQAADERTTRRFEVMLQEIDRFEQILSGYLSFSRPLEELRPGPVDLRGLLEQVAALFEARVGAAGIGMAVEADPASPAIQADARRLKEALMNLVSNAIEATPRGGTITLSVATHGRGVRLVVRDTGRGMTPQVLERLGTAFFTTRTDGTGLGFVLARTVVAQHGGTLNVSSAPGRGTSVEIVLPAAPRDVAEVAR